MPLVTPKPGRRRRESIGAGLDESDTGLEWKGSPRLSSQTKPVAGSVCCVSGGGPGPQSSQGFSGAPPPTWGAGTPLAWPARGRGTEYQQAKGRRDDRCRPLICIFPLNLIQSNMEMRPGAGAALADRGFRVLYIEGHREGTESCWLCQMPGEYRLVLEMIMRQFCGPGRP